MKDTYLTVQEVAEMLKISYDKALDFIKYSGVEYVQIGRQYRVQKSRLQAFLYPPKQVKQTLRRRPVYQIIERK
jgi:excisionase family DNA binding protein